MKRRSAKESVEALNRGAARAAGAMVIAACALFLSLEVMHEGQSAAKAPQVPMTKPGIGKNVEVEAQNVLHNSAVSTAATIAELGGEIGAALSGAVAIGATAMLIRVACKIEAAQKAEAVAAPQLVPTCQLVNPKSLWYPDNYPEPPVINLTDFAATQTLSVVAV